MRRLFAPIEGRVRLMIGRAIVALVDDARAAQELQVELLDAEAHDAVERFQNYGLTSVPHAGAEAVAVSVGGLRSHMLVIAVEDRRYRLTGLETGEVALYDDLDQKLHLTRDGIIVSTTKKITIEAGDDVLVDSASKVTVEAPLVVVASDNIQLGGAGGLAVARVGDPVVNGVISAGSAKVKAA